MDARYRRIAYLLVAESGLEWPWLSDLHGRPADMKRANKFLLGSILDYQMDANRAWDNAERFAEEELGDPEQLWHAIIERFPDANALADDKEFKWVHKLQQAKRRVVLIARELVCHYGGDARNIWVGQAGAEVLARLVRVGVGEQTSRRVVGALIDSGQVPGSTTDLPGDIHVKRVLGRSILGREADAAEAIDLGRQLHPENPWAMNNSIYRISLERCHAQEPACGDCELSVDCAWGSRAVSHEQRVGECLGWAEEFSTEGQAEAALEFASYAVELAPQNPLAHFWRAASYAQLGKHAEAVEDFTEAIRLDPKLGCAYGWRALCASRGGDHENAMADAARYVELASDTADACHVRGLVYQGMGKHAEAVEDFTRVIELAGDVRPSRVYRDRAVSLRELGRKREARQDEKKAERLEAEEAQ